VPLVPVGVLHGLLGLAGVRLEDVCPASHPALDVFILYLGILERLPQLLINRCQASVADVLDQLNAPRKVVVGRTLVVREIFHDVGDETAQIGVNILLRLNH
jgi:hypothetical protein